MSVRHAALSGRDERQPAGALRLLNVGYGNLVATGRIVRSLGAVRTDARLRDEATGRGKLVDATQGPHRLDLSSPTAIT